MPIANAQTIEEILNWTREHTLSHGRKIPVCIWSPRGAGKTQLIRNYCASRELGFRGYHPAHDADGSDIVGIAYRDEDLQRTMHARPMWLPGKNDAIEWQKEGIIFIDEINRANTKVLNGLLEPLGEGTLEKSNWELPEGWQFVLAANPPIPGYDVNPLDEAMMNRMIHVPLDFDVISWASWAETADLPRELISFTARYPDMFTANNDGELPDTIQPQATPRTMEYLARLYEPGMDEDLLLHLAKGLIGKVPGEAFVAHTKAVDKPVSAEEILTGKFSEKLGAHINNNRDDLVNASEVLLLSYLSKFTIDQADKLFPNIVAYIQMLGADRGSKFLISLKEYAPEWYPPVSAYFSTLPQNS